MKIDLAPHLADRSLPLEPLEPFELMEPNRLQKKAPINGAILSAGVPKGYE